MNDRQVKVGNIVIVSPNDHHAHLRANQATEVPGIVCAVFGPKTANIRVFTDSTHNPDWVTSVPHQSAAPVNSISWRFPEETLELPATDARNAGVTDQAKTSNGETDAVE